MVLDELAVHHGLFLDGIKSGIGCDEFAAHFKAHGIDFLDTMHRLEDGDRFEVADIRLQCSKSYSVPHRGQNARHAQEKVHSRG